MPLNSTQTVGSMEMTGNNLPKSEPRKISAKELVSDIGMCLSDAELCHKYRLSKEQLHYLMRKLVDKGKLEKSELERRVRLEGHQNKIRSRIQERAERQYKTASLSNGLDQTLLDQLIPINKKVGVLLAKDFIFWVVACLAAVPLAISSISGLVYLQLLIISIFFAWMWGLVFKWLIVYQEESCWLPIVGAFMFTGFFSMHVMVALKGWLIPGLSELTESPRGFTKLAAQILFVGVPEELCKIIPVFIFIYWRIRSNRIVDPPLAILIAVYSGLGFAGMENAVYAINSIDGVVSLSNKFGKDGVEYGTAAAIMAAFVRALNCVFVHAVWSGIFATFIVRGAPSLWGWVKIALMGLIVASTLHGFDNWFVDDHPIVSGGIAAFSFMLFYSYLTKVETGLVGETLRPGLPFFD